MRGVQAGEGGDDKSFEGGTISFNWIMAGSCCARENGTEFEMQSLACLHPHSQSVSPMSCRYSHMISLPTPSQVHTYLHRYP